MPPVRQSQRNRQAVQPYQAAGPPQLTIRQQRRQNEQRRNAANTRDGVPATYDGIQKRMRKDDKDSSIPEAEKIRFSLSAVIRELQKGRKTKISSSFGDLNAFERAYDKYNMGRFRTEAVFDDFTLLRSPK